MFRRALPLVLVVCSLGILFAAAYPAAGSIAETPTPTPDGPDDGSDDSGDGTAEDGTEADEDDEDDGSSDEADDEDDRWYGDWGSDDDRRSEYGSDGDGEDGDETSNASDDPDAGGNENDSRDGEDEPAEGDEEAERQNETHRRNGSAGRSAATDNRTGDGDDENRTWRLAGSVLDLTNDTVRTMTDGVVGDLDGDGDPDVELVAVDDGSVRVGGLGGEARDGAGGSDGGVEVVEVELEEDLIDDQGRLRVGNVTIGGVLVVPIGPPEILAPDHADEESDDRPSMEAPPRSDAMVRSTPADDTAAVSVSEGSGPDDDETTDGTGQTTDAGDDEDGAGDVPGSGAGAGAALLVTVGLLGGTRTAVDGTAVLASQGSGSTLTTLRHTVAGYVEKLPGGLLPALFGYSRHDGSDPLENETRAEIYDLVRESPGTYHAQLAEETGVAVETVRYHSRILAEEGLVEARKLRGRRRLFPVTMDDDDPELAAAIADSAASDVLSAIERREPTTLSALAEAVDCAPSTVSYHLDRLEDDGLVTRERDGGAVRVRLRRSTRSALQGQVADD